MTDVDMFADHKGKIKKFKRNKLKLFIKAHMILNKLLNDKIEKLIL
jgi:hypothetical protein